MLTEQQVDELWYDVLAAEVRSLYFADLGTRYTREKQIITGVSFFLSSGAAVTILSTLPPWVPAAMAALSALLTAYSIAVGLDKRATTMANLHYAWNQIETDKRRLWNSWFEDGSEAKLAEIESREANLSQLAVTDAPYNEKLLQKWREVVNKQYGIVLAQ